MSQDDDAILPSGLTERQADAALHELEVVGNGIEFELHGALYAFDRQEAETIIARILAKAPLVNVDHLRIDGEDVDAIAIVQRIEEPPEPGT